MTDIIKVGDKVSAPWWRNGKRVRNLRGYITRIDGAYHYVKVISSNRYDELELYPSEFKVVDN
jgi:hypothetical protein